MLLNLIIAVYCHKKYNVIAEHDNPIHIAENTGILSVLTDEDTVLRRTRVGYTMELSPETLEKIKKHPRIVHIEEDKPVKIAAVQYEDKTPLSFILQRNATWGLARIAGYDISQVTDKVYEYVENGGKNVNVYILDTGIDATHPEFEGRAILKYNGIPNSPDEDEQGHGTHCAGVIGSKSYGVAKKAQLIGVKILDKNGMGSISKLIEGIDFVIEDYTRTLEDMDDLLDNSENPFSSSLNSSHMFRKLYNDLPFVKRPLFNRRIQAVVNMSVGGEKSEALNFAIRRASNMHGIHFSTAAGNENRDACKFSPSSSSTSLTIGASDLNDNIAKFSNEGVCVNLYAPGVDILSTWPNRMTRVASGTSIATPHVTGIMAVYLSLAEFEPEELKLRIVKDADMKVKEQTYLPLVSSKKPFASLRFLYDRLKAANLS